MQEMHNLHFYKTILQFLKTKKYKLICVDAFIVQLVT